MTCCFKSVTCCFKSVTCCFKSVNRCFKSVTCCFKSVTRCFKSVTCCFKFVTCRFKSVTRCFKSVTCWLFIHDVLVAQDDRDDGDYLDCYALPMCARTQQRHKWIKSSATPRTDFDRPATTFVATVASDIVLHRLERFDLIPPGVRRPPKHCLVFVQEQEEERAEGSGEEDDSETSKVDTGGDDGDKQEMPEEAAPPPPVPPKPGNLPPLCVRQNRMRSQSYKAGLADDEAPAPPPKAVGSTPEMKRPGVRPKPRSAHGAPPPPPPTETDLDQLDEDPTTPTNKQPPSPSKRRSLSVVAETENGGTPRREQDSGYLGSRVSTVTNGVGDSDTEDDDEEESPYEAVSPGGQMSDDAATRLFVDESAFENGAEKSGSGSRESTPSTDSRGKSPMKDSIRSSTTSGGSDVFPSVQLPTRIPGNGPTSPRPPRLQPRSLAEVQVPAGDDQATDSDNSYYEDIENVDHRAPVSPSCKSSVSYLDPHSVHAESFERAEAIATVRSVSLSEWQAAGKLMLRRGDLLIAQATPACEDPTAVVVSDDTPAINKVFVNTTLVFDRGGHALYVPTVLLKRYGEPAGEPWYYPVSLTSREASLFLSREKQEGCFIVYEPSVPSSREVVYHLSVCRSADGDILHYNIVENIHGDLMIEGHDNSFMNIQDLVTYFQRNKSQLATRLRRPLKEAKLSVTPGYHYPVAWEIDRSLLSLNGKIIGKVIRVDPIDARTHAPTHARTHANTHTHTHTAMHAYTHADTTTHTRTHARTHTDTHTHTHTHTHAHTHTHTHTHTHAHTTTTFHHHHHHHKHAVPASIHQLVPI